MTDRSKVLAPSSLRSVVKLLRSVYTSAVLDRLVSVSPMTLLSLPSAYRERVIPLTVEQVCELADVIGDRYRAVVIVQAGLGLRIGELLGLQIGASTSCVGRCASSVRPYPEPWSLARPRRLVLGERCRCPMSWPKRWPSTCAGSRSWRVA